MKNSGRQEAARAVSRTRRITILTLIATVGIVVGMVPLLVVAVIGAIDGSTSGAIFTRTEDYPGSSTLSPLMLVPALSLAGACGLGFAHPLDDPRGPRRLHQGALALLGFLLATTVTAMDVTEPAWVMHVGSAAVIIFGAVLVAALARWIASALRIVPASWRAPHARGGAGRRSAR